jgi:ABC-type antimicrobial peptide transport system permease subunit
LIDEKERSPSVALSLSLSLSRVLSLALAWFATHTISHTLIIILKLIPWQVLCVLKVMVEEVEEEWVLKARLRHCIRTPRPMRGLCEGARFQLTLN